MTVNQILKQYWGYENFRPLQHEVIESVLEGKDTLALMPTGGGKSLCYQLPALAKPGLCLVVSPLIALMKDQVENLRKKNITAFAIHSGLRKNEVFNILKIASHSNCKFLYVSPERLETSLFMEYLPGLGVNLLAVDEAHCISQWGYDFRPPYLRIANLRAELPGVPVLALTASATAEVQDDICGKLLFQSKNIFRQSFERPNISYSVFRVDSAINKIIDIARNVGGSSIVYCRSRKRAKEIAALLVMHGFSADFYHAGLTTEERNRRQEEWINNSTRIIVCTNAFGMGIDKPDVRTVIHADPPDCLENYYQEAGRAGRDGKKSYAALLYGGKHIGELEESSNLRYPSLVQMREVYQAVANYLQIPAGGAEGDSFDFDLGDFVRKFKLNSQVVIYSLKALAQDGWLSFNEQVFLSSTVKFVSGKTYLYQFENDHPTLEPLMKTLLRAYEGIVDFPTSISEVTLAHLLKKQVEEIKQQLQELHRASIIDYTPQKDKPQLVFLRSRAKTGDLNINLREFDERKQRFVSRIESMINYIREEHECRSKMIGLYFGDREIKPCGICDNCLKGKSADLTREEFDLINSRIMDSMAGKTVHTTELFNHLEGVKKEKAWKVIDFLQAENKIELDNAGWLRLK